MTPEPPPQHVLHQMHATASRSTALTTFDDLTAPPLPASSNETKTIELVHGGLSSLYSRLKASVGASAVPTSTSSSRDTSAESLERQKLPARASSKLVKSPSAVAATSPVVVSLPSSRLQSPLAPSFPEHPLPPSRDSNASSSAVSHKASLNGSKSSLATVRSRPSIAPSVESARTVNDDEPFTHSPVSTTSTSKPHGAAPLEPPPRSGSSIGLASASRTQPSSYMPTREDSLRHQRNQIQGRGGGSESSEEDLVLVEGGAAAESSQHPYALDTTTEGLTKVTSRPDHQYKSSISSTQDLRQLSDVASEPTEKPRVTVTANAQTPVLAPAPQRPPLVQVGPSHLPGYRPSRASSSDGLSSIITSTTVRSPTRPSIEQARQRNTATPLRALPRNAQSRMQHKIIDRDFWMKDENAKECFKCGDAFSTFRRKHHCRTCGQIFDSKCTSLVDGKLFGQSGNLRVCKPCEGIIYGDDDDSSIYTEDEDQASLYERDEREYDPSQLNPSDSDHTKIGTPTISIPMSRKAGSEKKRRSAVIEVAPPTLPRPSSSRSLRSLGGRPRSSSHKRHPSKHQHMRNPKYEDRAPFHHFDTEGRNRSALPAFHHDNIIDPDLAPFMSDEDSSEDEQLSIFAALSGDMPSHNALDGEKGGLGGILASMRRGKSRGGDRSVVGAHARDTDNLSVTSRHFNRHPRKRNLSVSSITHRPSPRRSKSNSLLKPFGAGFNPNTLLGPAISPQPSHASPTPPSGSKITRSASMQGGNAPQIELNQASLQHVRKLLRQMLQDAGVAHVSSWEKALVPILLQCTDDVNPDLHRGDDIDIRNYIKLKKIVGGKPRDTSYISGVVFRKNIALKSMPRNISHPRILIITFAVEYARHQTHFMSLEPVIAQEKEYLRNLVGRIAALNPNVVLVQRNVSGLALEFLEQAGIAVAYNVKETVLNAVARCTQCKSVSSVDQLADTSRLGRCGSFDVKTYVHRNVRRTYIFLSGCQPDLGCTIALRGDESANLAKLKHITEFMCYVVFNLKLETCLMRDEFVLIPAVSNTGTLATGNQESEVPRNGGGKPVTQEQPGAADHSSSDEEKNQVRTTDGQVTPDLPVPSYYSEVVEKHRTKILSASPFVQFMQPYLLNKAREYEKKLEYLKKLRDQYTTDEDTTDEQPQKFELVQPEMVHVVVEKASRQVREFLHAVHASEYDKALHNYMTQRRQWEAYLATNMDVYDPFNHQRIAVLYSVVNTANSTPCIGPEIIALNFYQEHDYDDGFTPDCTLGQYVEDLCHSANLLCEVDGCNRRMLDHSRQYVHAEGQMSVIVQNSPSRIKGLQNTILMWSCCRVCGQETQVIPMSDSTWKYSFAKYLELTFWSTELHPRAGICPHDIHKNHVRYFGFNNMALRIQYDAIQLYEVIVPRPIVTWKVDSDLRLKNDQFLKIEERLDRFMASVRSRIKGIHVESVIPEKVEACRTEVERLMKRANDEHEWLRRKLQNKYMNSKYYEIIPLNRAIRAIQEKAIAWDETFMDFEQQFFPSEKDIRRLATLQLKKLFLERDESTSSLTSVEEGSEAVEEPALNEKNGPLALAPVPSNMSPERAHDMLTSVVEEHQSGGSSKPVDDSQKQVEGQESVSKEAPTSHNLPIPTPMEAVERDEVRHLDLAVASGFSESPVVMDESLVKTPTLPAQCTFDEPESPTPIALPKTNPIDEVLGEAASNPQTSPPPQQTAFSSLESKIPRLVDTIRREAATPKRPALLTRTQSQPGNTAKHNSAPSKVTPTNGPDSPKGPLGGESTKVFDRISERLVLGAFKSGKGTSKIPRSIPLRNQREYSKVSKLAEHFEQLSKEFQKERMRERRNERNRQMRAYPLASSKPVVEVYKDVHEAVQEENPSDEDAHVDSSLRASIDNSTLGDSNLTETTGNTTSSSSPVEERHPKDGGRRSSETGLPADTPSQASDVENEVSDAEMAPEEVPLPDSIASSDILSMTDSQLENSLELPKHEKNTLMKMLTSFWSERSASGWVPLDYPFAQIEHVWEDSDIIVREDEPSSIIALALSNPDYLARLQSFREPVETANGMETLDQSIQRNLLRPKNSEIRYSFTNRGVKAQCKIFYAQSFDALRRKCGVADRFVESLSRCSKWDSKGGKSKSIFLKTLDDRFVVKSLSPIETQAFFRFGPNYFDFTHQNLFKGLPSVIAKMFGLFQVQIKTPTGRDFDWFMLVMENLFYDREPNRRYDLKGSMRNRKIESTGERDEVLLDENLVDIIYSETPIFVREHTKKLLKASVWNDTLFLSHNNVMDYSLMAGFDDTNREIIVGIIDCIRTYTWDKKLESWIKDRGKNKPTITSPRDYRNRFRIAMEKYILQAPNCWYQFQARVVGVGVERHAAAAHGSSSSGVGNAADARETKTVVLREADERRRRSHQVLDVEGGGEVEKAAARMM